MLYLAKAIPSDLNDDQYDQFLQFLAYKQAFFFFFFFQKRLSLLKTSDEFLSN